MVGLVEGDERLGVPGGLEDHAGLIDPDDGVSGRVQDEERLAERGDALQLGLGGQVAGQV